MSNPVIVVLDDQSFVCDLIKTMLKDKYTVQAFTSGETAIKYLASHPVDLVLLDYDMPNVTGYEVLMAIRSDKNICDTPIIFITGVTNARMEEEMIERGANDYIRKPIEMSTLHQCVEKYLKM